MIHLLIGLEAVLCKLEGAETGSIVQGVGEAFYGWPIPAFEQFNYSMGIVLQMAAIGPLDHSPQESLHSYWLAPVIHMVYLLQISLPVYSP